MLDATITLLNYDESLDNYYINVINSVEIQSIYKTVPNNYETSDDSSCLIIIPYEKEGNKPYININSQNKFYLPPKKWNETEDNKKQYFTIQNNLDIVLFGDYSNGDIFINKNLNELKNSLDYVFVINEFSDFREDLISHFELIVN